MELNKTELKDLLIETNERFENLINLQYVERDGKQYIIETNEMFGLDDYITERIIETIDNYLAPRHYLEPEISNVYHISE